MQMLHDAITPEALELFKAFERLDKIDSVEAEKLRINEVSEGIARKRELAAEERDRREFQNRHERRKAAALAR